MHSSQQPERSLLTALELQDLLHVDRSTIYRMAEDGRLPAIRVGRSWRFPADEIRAMLAAEAARPAGSPATRPAAPNATRPPATRPAGSPAGSQPARPAGSPATRPPAPTGSAANGTRTPAPLAAHPMLNLPAARAVVEVAADLLGVMMVVTDMQGQPLTAVANRCARFEAVSGDPATLATCIAEWRDLADHPDLAPRFQPGALGFECARAFIRSGTTLVGMVLAGGLSPAPDAGADPDLYHLDDAGRERVLATLPRIAAAISPTPPQPAADRTDDPEGVATKEHP